MSGAVDSLDPPWPPSADDPRIGQLRAEVAALQHKVETLRAENEALRVENSQLHGRNIELCRGDGVSEQR